MKIISGGQTGIDRLGLEVARELGLETGGIAPRDYWTETGSDLTLRLFGLEEDAVRAYKSRTRRNVIESDGTVMYGDTNSGGSEKTVRLCETHGKPVIVNPSAEDLAVFILNHRIQTLNVAGNRGSKLSAEKIEEYREMLREGLKKALL